MQRGDLVFLWWSFCSLGPVVPSEERFFCRRNSIGTIIFILWWHISIPLGVVSSSMTVFVFIGRMGSVNDLIIMKNDVNHLLRLSQLIDLNQIEHLWEILDQHQHQNTKWGNIFWRNGVPNPSTEFQSLGKSMWRLIFNVFLICGQYTTLIACVGYE